MRFLAALLTFFAAPLAAQDWATRELCFSDPLPVTAEDVAPLDLATIESAAAAIPNGRGKFWQIAHPSGTVSYLWGTMHSDLAPVLNVPKPVVNALAASDTLALEFDATFPDRTAIYQAYDTPGRFRDPGSAFLPDPALDLSYLGPAVPNWILARLDETGYGEDALFALTYAGLAELLLSSPCADFTTGVFPIQDSYLHTLAHIAGTRVISLEDPNDFLRDLSEDAETAKAIVATYASYLEPIVEIRNFNAGAQLYLEGRLGFMAAWDHAWLAHVYPANGRDFVQRTDNYMLSVRNKRFMERLLPELSSGSVFIAVGSAHLPGDTGLVNLLRAEGLSVQRVTLPSEVP